MSSQVEPLGQAELPFGETLACTPPRQLPLPLGSLCDSPAHLIVSAANARAVALLEEPAGWPSRAMVLAGPRQSGRSLHARLAAARGARVLDSADRREEEGVFDAWNAAQDGGPPLLMIAERLPPLWAPRLSDLRSRLAASALAVLDHPDDPMADALLEHLLIKRGIASSERLRREARRPLERTHLALVRFADAVEFGTALTRGSIGDAHQTLGVTVRTHATPGGAACAHAA